jgi:hypothetical protein
MRKTQGADMHPTRFYIKPAPGLRIADPQSGEYLPDAGALMPRSGFWLRRLADGDVVDGSAPEDDKKAKLPGDSGQNKQGKQGKKRETPPGEV